MVVTDSRKAAVRYKKAIDAYIAKQRLHDIGTLVAFSGAITDDGVTFAKAEPTFTEANMNPGLRGRTCRRLRHRPVQDHDRRQQVPDRLRPAAAVRRCTSTRSCPGSPRCRRCPGSTAPTAPPAGSRSARRSSSTSSTSPRTIQAAFEPYFTERHPGDRDRPERRPRPRDQARPGRHLHRGPRSTRSPSCGSPARATTPSPRRSARPSTTSRAATPGRSRRTTRSPSTRSTCSARTSAPSSGSTTS